MNRRELIIMFYDSKNFFLGQWENKMDEMGECVCGSSSEKIKRPESIDPGLLAVRGSHSFESLLARSNLQQKLLAHAKRTGKLVVYLRVGLSSGESRGIAQSPGIFAGLEISHCPTVLMAQFESGALNGGPLSTRVGFCPNPTLTQLFGRCRPHKDLRD
jgi:hypothetical protein